MTANTIANYRAHEEHRSNLMNEHIERAKVHENKRHNRRTEGQTDTDLAQKWMNVVLRSKEFGETVRHNMITEGISKEQAEAQLIGALANEISSKARAWETYNFSPQRVAAELMKGQAAKIQAKTAQKRLPAQNAVDYSSAAFNAAKVPNIIADTGLTLSKIVTEGTTQKKQKSESGLNKARRKNVEKDTEGKSIDVFNKYWDTGAKIADTALSTVSPGYLIGKGITNMIKNGNFKNVTQLMGLFG